MKTQLTFFASVAIIGSILLTSCERHFDSVTPISAGSSSTETTPPAPTNLGDFKILAFDPATMKTQIDNFLNAQQLSGYAYTIFVNGQRVVSAEGNSGFARKAIDSPERGHNPLARQEVASCSKYITTLAMVRMIERAGLTLDYPIWPFLPSYMNPSPNFKNITFRQLLSHHTGITLGQGDLNITLAEMQQAVETPINISQYDQYLYNNMNFALCRLVLPYLYWKQVLKIGGAGMQQKEANQTNLDTDMANTFLYFVRNDVFKLAGLSGFDQLGAVDPFTNSSAMYYNNNFAGFGGVVISPLNDIRNLGSAGFDLSAVELAQITSAARDNKIVSAASMQAIKNGYKNRPLGFNDSATGKYGEYYYKYGGATWNTNGASGGLATMIVDFHCASANVQVAVVSNENDSDVSNINWIRAAFDNSWK